MKKIVIIISLICIAFQAKAQNREVQLLDTGWKFLNKEISATTNEIDDSSWSTVTVPHDWAIAGPFDMNIDLQAVQVLEDGDKKPKLRTGRTGALPCFGIGWYRIILHYLIFASSHRLQYPFPFPLFISILYYYLF